jgi:hypothetical protein
MAGGQNIVIEQRLAYCCSNEPWQCGQAVGSVIPGLISKKVTFDLQPEHEKPTRRSKFFMMKRPPKTHRPNHNTKMIKKIERTAMISGRLPFIPSGGTMSLLINSKGKRMLAPTKLE